MDTTLELLELEAQALSARRRELLDRIQGLYREAPLNDDQSRLLYSYETRERAVSARRHDLHHEIDCLRSEVGLPRWTQDRSMNQVPSPAGVRELVSSDGAVAA